jgi:periplasmic copper chaperone A
VRWAEAAYRRSASVMPPGAARSAAVRRRRRAAAALTVLAMTALGALPGTGSASAHVTANAPDAAPGGYSTVTLRVPDESSTASTVKLEVTLPQEHPFAEVRTAPVPGWDIAVHRTTLPQPIDDGDGGKVTEAVSAVTFTARDGNAIGPGQFGEFRLLLGPLPKSGDVFLPAVQSYSDGSTVSWIERSTDGTEPAHPAPALHLDGPPPTGHPHAGTTPTATAESAAAPSNSGGRATLLASIALIVALLGLATSAYPLLRVRTDRDSVPGPDETRQSPDE